MDTALLELLKFTRERGASDLHVKAESPARFRMNGVLRSVKESRNFTGDEIASMLASVMTREAYAKFNEQGEADFAIVADEVGRFRCNAYRQRGTQAFVARAVAPAPKTLDDLGLPSTLADLAMSPRGLILVTGPTGSGKTTTLAAMLDHINDNRAVHIVTVEDPIEVLHHDKMASISQRELGMDTSSWTVAMRAAMRQDPDVILIGEMRDRATVHAALEAAETGHLVLSTLHTSTVMETIVRILDFYPAEEKQQVRSALAQSTRGILCQRLLPKISAGGGRVCALEIGIVTGALANAIENPEKTADIPGILEDGRQYGMQAFDQHLVKLVAAGTVSIDSAIEIATSRDDFKVRLRQAGIRMTAA